MGGTRAGRVLGRAVAWLAAALALGAMAAPPRAIDYARAPAIRSVVVSPSNARAAMLTRAPNGRMGLATVDLANGRSRFIAGYDDVDIVDVAWVNDQRLVYSAQQPGARIEYEKWGSFAIDHDGADHRHLITARSDTEAATGSAIRYRVLTREWSTWKPVGDGSDEVYALRWANTPDRGWRPVTVARLDTQTGRARTVTEGQPDQADGWLFDAKGRLAVVTSTHQAQRRLWWQAEAGAPWTLVREWSRYGDGALEPVALEGDATLVVAARAGRDTTALFAFDLRKGELGREPLAAADGVDVDAVRFDPRAGRVVGVPIDAGQPSTVWFDEGLARAQSAVDKALPAGRSNTLLCGQCAGARRFVVHSTGDRQPGEYFIFDADTGRLNRLGRTRPWIVEDAQGRRSWHRVAARDGLSLPVVVTHPASRPADQPAPTVLLVHGGPWAPGAMLPWEAEAQYLAALGYRVLQVSFRGTTGLGWKHFRASWGEYGLSMQDDLEDALLWAVKEKLTDPDRVCIYGASYGGYAALMGPVRHPGRYRCAISHVGVTDLSLLFSWNWSDVAPVARDHDLKLLIGDPAADAEKLRRMSPLHRVADIKVPLLVAQGRLDRRVTPEHADRFVAAARAAGVEVERVDYDEGHGFGSAGARADFWNRLAAFLTQHLGPR